MRYLISLFAICLMWLAAPAAAQNEETRVRDYQAGQIWTYKSREIDDGSLVKIGAIETVNGETVYHISIINVRYGPNLESLPIGHLPVSKQTLDDSLLEQVASDEAFPDPSEGIAIWREDNGGWFTIPIIDIIQFIVARL